MSIKQMKNVSVWVFSSITFFLIIAIFFIMCFSVGPGSHGSIGFTDSTLSAWVTALATVSIAILTFFLAKETRELRRIQLVQIEQIRKNSLKPAVNLYLKSAPVSFQFINIHIINNGVGIAQNIKFKFKNESNEAQNVYDYLQKEFNKLAILSNGISSLGAGEERSSFLFSFIELKQKFGDKTFDYISEIEIEFEDIEGQLYSSKSYINFMEYEGISELGGGDPLYKISSTLEKIQRNIDHFSSGFKKLKTDIEKEQRKSVEKK